MTFGAIVTLLHSNCTTQQPMQPDRLNWKSHYGLGSLPRPNEKIESALGLRQVGGADVEEPKIGYCDTET
jgi:hypothetical protein